MKKLVVFGILCILLFFQVVKASDLPMLPVKTSPKSPQANSYQNNNNFYDNSYYNNYQNRCYSDWRYCIYSTTLTTKELRARSEARRKAKLEKRCKMNKAPKNKCIDYLEED